MRTVYQICKVNNMLENYVIHWLDVLPKDVKKQILKLDSYAGYQHKLLQKQRTKQQEILLENQQLKEQFESLQKQRDYYKNLANTLSQRVTNVTLSSNELWQAWHEHVDSILPDYVAPTKSGNVEITYIAYLSHLKEIQSFQKELLNKLMIDKKDDQRIHDLNQLEDLLRQISCTKM